MESQMLELKLQRYLELEINTRLLLKSKKLMEKKKLVLSMFQDKFG